MSDKAKQNIKEDSKIQTKYDRKIEERKKKEEKEKRNSLVLRVAAWVIGIVFIAAVGFSITSSVLNKNAATKDTYVTIGTHEITKLEFDYYYKTVSNSYVTNYASILQYMGLDTTKDYADQQYSDTMTWKDLFDQMAVEQILNTKELSDDAAKNAFVYDTAKEYKSVIDNMKTSAETEGIAISKFYEKNYGSYANEKNMEPIIKEGILTAAYYDELLKKNAPSDQEIKDYYNENTQSYDKVDYRSFTVKADVAEDAEETDVDRAMLEAKKKADVMMEERKSGTDFKELCIQNASEDEKATYENADTDASLFEGKYYSDMPVAAMEWLYEDGRKAGDIAVLEDSGNNQYYVVEFNNRYFDEADNQTIANTMASDRVVEYMTKLSANYEVTDNKGELKYLTIPKETETETK